MWKIKRGSFSDRRFENGGQCGRTYPSDILGSAPPPPPRDWFTFSATCHSWHCLCCEAMYVVFHSNFAAYIVCRRYKPCEFLGLVWTDCWWGNKSDYDITSPANGWEYFGCSSNCLVPNVTIFTKMQFSGKCINIFTIFFSIYFWGINHTMITIFWHNRKELTQLFLCVL